MLVDTTKVTAPPPVPLAPAVIVMNDALLVAVQGQPACVVTVTLPTPPVRSMFCEAGAIEYVQAGATPACVTLNV